MPSSVIPPLELCLLRIITNWPHVCKLKTCLLTIPGGKVNIDNKEAYCNKLPLFEIYHDYLSYSVGVP
jgi:hypothetical protein